MAVECFARMLQSSAAHMAIRIPTKQMMLLTHLLKHYFSEVSKDS